MKRGNTYQNMLVDTSNLQDVMQFESLPEPSAKTVGKIFQYVGETDENFTQGYFYIGTVTETVEEELDEETNETVNVSYYDYGYENINVQTNSGGGSETKYTFTSLNSANTQIDNTANRDTMQGIYDEYKANSNINIENIRFNFKGLNSGDFNDYGIAQSIFISNAFVSIVFIDYSDIYSNRTNNYGVAYNRSKCYIISSNFNSSTGLLSNISISNTFRFCVNPTNILGTTNTSEFIPTGDYNPATKKYVDDKLPSYAGYDATKTQVLKNVEGTLTWVTEE